MTSRSRGVLGVWALLRESHGVDLELGWHWCASHNSLLESIRFSATRVCSANVCDHDEISESNTVAGSKLATVMGQVTLHQLVERGTDADNFGNAGCLVSRLSKHNSSTSISEISPGFDDRVAVHGSLEILGVVVAIFDGKHAHDGSELSQTVRLAVDDDGSHGEATKLTNITGGLSSTPACEVPALLVIGLTVVSEHLLKRGTATLHAKVFPLDSAGEDSLALLGAFSGGSATRLGSWSA